MTQQLQLFKSPRQRKMIQKRQPQTIGERFEAFDRDNPEVYTEIRRLALEAVATGRTRLGIKELWEVARWHLNLRVRGAGYKLNNSYAPLYARKLMALEPSLVGKFETRQRRVK